jgi:hypothetical protein
MPLQQQRRRSITELNSGVECPRLNGGTSWSGEVIMYGNQSYPISFQVGIRKGKAVNGTITWTTLEDTKTKVQGSI